MARSGGAFLSRLTVPEEAMPFPLPLSHDDLSDREREAARWHPERETLELATAGAARALGEDHRATMALAKAAITMDKADLWQARLAVKTLRLEQRQAIALAVEAAWEGEED